MPDVIEVVACHNRLGEGPYWDNRDQTLYWVDIDSARLFSFQPMSGQVAFTQLPLTITAIGARASGGLVVATRTGLGFFDPVHRALHGAHTILEEDDILRFNDGAVDPLGRFWAGTYNQDHQPTSALYRFDPDLSIHLIEKDLVNSNGIDWSPDRKTMYHTHTTERTIYAYDFDPESGEVGNRRAFICVPDEPGEGRPDGLTVDSEGFIWSARYAGGKICRYDPEGRIERAYTLPVINVTACEFGGPDRNILYITTAWSSPTQHPESQEGNLFSIETGFTGKHKPLFLG